MAPSNGTQQRHQVHSPKVGHQAAPQTIAHYNGTLQWHQVHSPKVGRHPPPNHSTLQWHPTIAPSNGTTSSAPWCHVQSAKVVRRPPPLLEVRTPIAIAIWGKKLGCLGFLGDYTTYSDAGITSSTTIRIPSLNNQNFIQNRKDF